MRLQVPPEAAEKAVIWVWYGLFLAGMVIVWLMAIHAPGVVWFWFLVLGGGGSWYYLFNRWKTRHDLSREIEAFLIETQKKDV